MKTELPIILETKLADFRRRVWMVKLLEGVLAAAFGIALSYLLVFVLDRFWETPGWVRLLLLIGGAAIFIEMARRFVFSASRRKEPASRRRYPECCCDDRGCLMIWV